MSVSSIKAAQLWFTRLKHRANDMASLIAFSFSPFSSFNTQLIVRRRPNEVNNDDNVVLNIAQWPGSKVGSGGFVWDGARRLALHLEQHGDGCGANSHTKAIASRQLQSLSVLELGSGTGAAGLAAAALGARSVTITDQASFCFKRKPLSAESDSLLDLMRLNVCANDHLLETKPQVAEFLWGENSHMAKLPPLGDIITERHTEYNHYDIICGTDILLFVDATAALVKSLRHLSCPSTVVVIEHTDRSNCSVTYPSDLLKFFAAIQEDGLWSATVVRDEGRNITIRMVRRQTGDDTNSMRVRTSTCH